MHRSFPVGTFGVALGEERSLDICVGIAWHLGTGILAEGRCRSPQNKNYNELPREEEILSVASNLPAKAGEEHNVRERSGRRSDAAAKVKRLISNAKFGRWALDVGFYAKHLESGEVIEVNPDRVFPTASVFKVPVMAEVFRQVRAGKFALEDRVTLAETDKTLTTGILLAFDAGLQPTIRDLAEIMNIVSDNTATTMLVNLVGRENINELMAEIGCPEINVTLNVHEMFLHAWHLPLNRPVTVKRLARAAGDKPMDYESLTFDRSSKNTVATARATARLFEKLARGTIVDRKASREMLDILRRQHFTNRVVKYLPWGSYGNKTGSMRGLRNDSGLIWRGRRDRIVYSAYTFDPTPLPANNSELLVNRNEAVDELLGRIGLVLWDQFGRPTNGKKVG